MKPKMLAYKARLGARDYRVVGPAGLTAGAAVTEANPWYMVELSVTAAFEFTALWLPPPGRR